MLDFRRPAKSRNPIRILLVDDQLVFRAGLRALLEKQPDLCVVGEAGRGDEAVACAKVTRPDVVLMDLAMPGEGGLDATRRIAALGLGAKVIVLTALTRERELLEALEAGANGFVEKMAPAEDVARGIRTVAAGGRFLGVDAAKLVVLQRYQKGVQATQ
ncbi:MAG TPA: response regulator transcription factor [Gemmatimonadales bacterium]|nr:response regulator transcription factor [Gemmatimonadales bacterium]